MSMAAKDTHPAVMADSGSPPVLRPVGGHDRAQPCWIRSLWRALNGWITPRRHQLTPGAARPTDLEALLPI